MVVPMDQDRQGAPSNPMPMRWLGALLLAGVVAVPACGDDDSGASNATVPDDRPTTETTRSTTSTTEEPEAEIRAEVEDAYYAQWDAFVEIFSDPDPANPLIDEHFTGAAREQVLNSIGSEIANGTITRPPEDDENFQFLVESIEILGESEAVVIDCLVDGLVAVDRSTGQVLNDRVVSLRTRNTFRLEDGHWKISDTEVLEELGEGVKCGG